MKLGQVTEDYSLSNPNILVTLDPTQIIFPNQHLVIKKKKMYFQAIVILLNSVSSRDVHKSTIAPGAKFIRGANSL